MKNNYILLLLALGSLNATIDEDFKNCSKVIKCVNLVLDDEKIKTIEKIGEKVKQINKKISDNCKQQFDRIKNPTISSGCEKIVNKFVKQVERQDNPQDFFSAVKDIKLALWVEAIETKDFKALEELLKKN
jgi:hypothetical protein